MYFYYFFPVLKMYHFNPNNYGAEYAVVAETPEQALEYLKKYLKDESDKHMKDYWNPYAEVYCFWKDATIDKLPNKYTIDEYTHGKVFESEIA